MKKFNAKESLKIPWNLAICWQKDFFPVLAAILDISATFECGKKTID
jgi:hypothetical protein